MLQDICQQEHPDLIIGTSMGGMYTEMLYGYDRILINPAFEIADTMGAHGMTGKQVFQNPRKDGIQEFMVTKAIVKEYHEMQEQCFKYLEQLPDETFSMMMRSSSSRSRASSPSWWTPTTSICSTTRKVSRSMGSIVPTTRCSTTV